MIPSPRAARRSRASEFHQILGERDRPRIIFLRLIDIALKVVFGISRWSDMGHDHGLDAGLRRHLADVLRRHVLLVHVAQETLLLAGSLGLPNAVLLIHLDDVFR